MKYKKIAKDTNGNILQEGDVIQLHNGNIVEAAINKITQPVREQFPELEVVIVTTDWKGTGIDVKKQTLDIHAYKTCSLLPLKHLRDDVPKFKKLKEVAEKAAKKAPFKRRVLL